LRKDPRKRQTNLHAISAYDFIQANLHDFHADDGVDTDSTLLDPDDDHGDAEAQAEEDNSTELLAFLSKQKGSTYPSHLTNVLSMSKAKNGRGVKFMSKPNASPAPPSKDEEIVINGK